MDAVAATGGVLSVRTAGAAVAGLPVAAAGASPGAVGLSGLITLGGVMMQASVSGF